VAAVCRHPGQGSLDRGKRGREEISVARAPVVLPCQLHEQRRGVDAAVIMAEGDLAQVRHFSQAALVEDLPWLGIELGPTLLGLVTGKIADDAAREVRLEPQAL